MTTHTRLRLGAVALVLLVVVLLSGAHLCGVAQDPGSRPLSAGALACTEFWLNRYQTLIAALIAGSIAYWAGRLLFKQVETQRFDFLGRQVTDLQSIQTAAWELWRSCNEELGPGYKIRMHGDAPEIAALAAWEIKAIDFWKAIQKAREAIVRLETHARRPIGPFETAREAEALARAAGEYLQVCQADAMPRLAPLGMFGRIVEQGPEVRERHPETSNRHGAISDALNEVIRTYNREIAKLQAEQARAHSVAR